MPNISGFLSGIGSGMKKTMHDDNFINALAGMQGQGGDDVFSKIMGGIGKGAGMAQQFKQAQHAKANAMTPPALSDPSAVPLAGPPGGGVPPGVGEAGIPGMPPAGPAPSPEMIGPPAGTANSGDMSAGENMGGTGGIEDQLKKALRMGQMSY
jgi:hypothetical protein